MLSSCYKQKTSKSPQSKKKDSLIQVGIKAGNKKVLPQYLPATMLTFNDSCKDMRGRNERMHITDDHFVLSSAKSHIQTVRKSS